MATPPGISIVFRFSAPVKAFCPMWTMLLGSTIVFSSETILFVGDVTASKALSPIERTILPSASTSGICTVSKAADPSGEPT